MNTPILLQQPRVHLSQRQLSQETTFSGSATMNNINVKIDGENGKQSNELGDHLTPRDRSIDALAMSPIDSRRWSSNKKMASRIPSRLSIESKLSTAKENDDVLGDMPRRAGLRRDSDMRRTSRRRLNVNPDISDGFNGAMPNSELLNNMGMNVSLAFDDGLSLLNERTSKLEGRETSKSSAAGRNFYLFRYLVLTFNCKTYNASGIKFKIILRLLRLTADLSNEPRKVLRN